MIYNVRKIDTGASVILDFIRGMSAQAVLVGHLLSFYLIDTKSFLIQNFGVLIFFLLSGFLITQVVLIKEKTTIKSFIVDRFSRIYFTYLPALVLIALFDSLLDVDDETFVNTTSSFIANAFLLQSIRIEDILNIQAFGSARPFWTISIEWWIYVFFGGLFYCFVKKEHLTIFTKTLFLVSVPVVFYYLNNRGGGLTIYWFLGSVLALVYNQIPVNFRLTKKMFFLILSSLIIAIVYRATYYRDMYDIGVCILFGLILLSMFYMPVSIKLIVEGRGFSGFSKFFASYSYSLYLVHYSTIIYFKNSLHLGSARSISLLFIMCNIIAFIFYLGFEKYHYKFRERLYMILNLNR